MSQHKPSNESMASQPNVLDFSNYKTQKDIEVFISRLSLTEQATFYRAVMAVLNNANKENQLIKQELAQANEDKEFICSWLRNLDEQYSFSNLKHLLNVKQICQLLEKMKEMQPYISEELYKFNTNRSTIHLIDTFFYCIDLIRRSMLHYYKLNKVDFKEAFVRGKSSE